MAERDPARTNYRTFERGPDSLVFPTAIRPTTGSRRQQPDVSAETRVRQTASRRLCLKLTIDTHSDLKRNASNEMKLLLSLETRALVKTRYHSWQKLR